MALNEVIRGDFQVTTNIGELQDWLDEVRRSQLPFAAAVALTRTARDARDAVKEVMPRKFTLRSQWLQRGVQSTRAEKTDWPNPQASVIAGWHPKYNRTDDHLALHELGGIKRSRDGGTLAIPTRAIRRSKSGKITKANRPKRLIASGKAWPTDEAIVRKRTKRNRLATLYWRRTEAKIKPRFDFQQTVNKAFADNYKRRFFVAMAEAVRTRKPKNR